MDLIWEKIGDGETIEDLLLAYPHLTKEAVLACTSFRAISVQNEILTDVA